MNCSLKDHQTDFAKSSCHSSHNCAWKFNRSSQIPMIRDQIAAILSRFAYGPRDIFSVQLALEEALVNAVKHGNAMNPQKQVTVTTRINRRRAWIRIEDEGAGFVPADVPDPRLPENRNRPSGRGVLLMRKFLDQVEYNEKGNVVRLCKIRRKMD